jgi:ribosomal protein S18 acetylase RimI-like enzyme
MSTQIKTVTLDELNQVTALFNQYMIFYAQPSNPNKYRAYLKERLENQEADIFIAFDEHQEAQGFVLNYTSFSSVSLGKVIVLNDLFVVPDHRQKGVANALIERVEQFAKEKGAIRVDLSTAKDNVNAQALYEKMGFKQGTNFFSYSLKID